MKVGDMVKYKGYYPLPNEDIPEINIETAEDIAICHKIFTSQNIVSFFGKGIITKIDKQTARIYWNKIGMSWHLKTDLEVVNESR